PVWLPTRQSRQEGASKEDEMAQLVADYVLKRLREWGIHRVFGYPGDGINGFLGAFDRADGDPEFIQSRHEEMAAFMACGHAKFSEEIGCCIATSGPGAIHLLNGLYDAKLDHAPVLAIVGLQKRMLLGAGVAKALLGKDVLPDDLPFVTGSIGLLGTTASYELIKGCDTLLMVGTSFPYSEFLPKEGQARCVEIELDPSRIGIRYPVDV